MNHRKTPQGQSAAHAGWVRVCHWAVTLGFLFLVFSGIEILMVHPRLYWGEVGNELTEPILELPISRNHRHGGWEAAEPFFETAGSPVSAGRTFDQYMFNQNGWGRSLHFLAAWVLVAGGMIYLLLGFFSGHFRRHIWPRRKELTRREFWREVRDHLRLKIPPPTGGPRYGLLQKSSYVLVIFVALPLAVVTGLTMSPAVTAALPVLLDLFGGYQSARTIHFFASLALELFLLVHLCMLILSGFKQQVRYMILAKKP